MAVAQLPPPITAYVGFISSKLALPVRALAAPTKKC